MFLETICIIDSQVCNAEYHMKRMLHTANHFGFDICALNGSNKPTNNLVHLILGLVERMPSELKTGKVKCRVAYHTQVNNITFERYSLKKVESLKLVETSIEYKFKFADRQSLNNLLRQKEDCDEILITINGFVTDTTYSNIVLRQHGKLYTPSNPLLNGTKRQKLLQEGVVEEKHIHRETLPEYECIYLINAMLDISDNISISTCNIV